MTGQDRYVDKRGHTPATCQDDDCTGCGYCTGGLDCCTVCNGGEGSMPSQCPGVRMTGVQADEVYAGRLDYRDGLWVTAPSRNSPTGIFQAAEALGGDE